MSKLLMRLRGLSRRRDRPAEGRPVARVAMPLAALSALLLMPAVAMAEWQPSKPISFIVMAGPGGGADKATRFLVDVITRNKMAPVAINVVNKPGRSGGEALAEMVAHTSDDHVILFTLNSFYTTPLMQPDLKVDIAKFAPIARLAEDVFLLWVNKDRTDINSIDDFVKAVKAKGKNWVMAGTGKGAEDQMLTDFLNATYGLDMTYHAMGGGGAVAKELAEKRADSTVNNPSEQTAFYPKGLTKPIIAFTPQRLTAFASVPTLRETGMDFHYYMQRSVVGTPGMSADARAWYERLFHTVFNGPEWQAYRAQNSLSGAFVSAGPLMNYWMLEREKHVRWRMAIELMGAGAAPAR